MFLQRTNFSSAICGLVALLLTGSACLAAPKTITVAADGSGDYKTIQEAILAVPDNSQDRTTIHIKAGIYHGPVVVTQSKINVTFEVAASEKTILTYDKNVRDPRPEGAHIFNPNLNVMGNDFRAENLTIQNTSGDHGQVLAMRGGADHVVFEHCRLLGWQDTLLLDQGRYYFNDCYVEGRVDFIYGSGTAVFDHCEIHSKNGGYVTAADTTPDVPYGFVFLNCKLTGDSVPWVDPANKTATRGSSNPTAALGRPWGPYASVAYINCKMGDHINLNGWDNWGKTENEKTARYAEYGTQTLDGKPIDLSPRASWAKRLTSEEASRYRLPVVLGGWNPTLLTPVTKAAQK